MRKKIYSPNGSVKQLNKIIFNPETKRLVQMKIVKIWGTASNEYVYTLYHTRLSPHVRAHAPHPNNPNKACARTPRA
jgi:hypothetical protein